jgi:hypothetical protein
MTVHAFILALAGTLGLGGLRTLFLEGAAHALADREA